MMVLTLTFAAISVEGYYDIEIDLEPYMPLLITMGIGGSAIKIAKQVNEAKQKIPQEIQSSIREEVSKLKKNHTL